MVLTVYQHLTCAESKAWQHIFQIWVESDVGIIKSPASNGPIAYAHFCLWCAEPLSKLGKELSRKQHVQT